VSLLIAGLLLFLATSAIGMLVSALIVLRLPADYFSRSVSGPLRNEQHPILRWTIRIVKNVVGVVIAVVGIVLTLPGVPGPGILTILLGLMLMDFPGKRRFERWLISRPGVFAAANHLRQRYGKPAFTL